MSAFLAGCGRALRGLRFLFRAAVGLCPGCGCQLTDAPAALERKIYWCVECSAEWRGRTR